MADKQPAVLIIGGLGALIAVVLPLEIRLTLITQVISAATSPCTSIDISSLLKSASLIRSYLNSHG